MAVHQSGSSHIWRGNYLITVDHYSDCIEVDELHDTLSSTIASKSEAHIARHGIPEIELTDNGPQFVGGEYEGQCHRYCIQHITSSPYWPQKNGKAEASVKVVKGFMKKSGRNNVQEALLTSRNTQSQGHLERCTALFQPTYTGPYIHSKLIPDQTEVSKLLYEGCCWKFEVMSVGDFVYAKPPPLQWGRPWPHGVITEKPAQWSYVVGTPSGTIRRNRVHISPAVPPPQGAMIPRSWQKYTNQPIMSNPVTTDQQGIRDAPVTHRPSETQPAVNRDAPVTHCPSGTQSAVNQPTTMSSNTHHPNVDRYHRPRRVLVETQCTLGQAGCQKHLTNWQTCESLYKVEVGQNNPVVMRAVYPMIDN